MVSLRESRLLIADDDERLLERLVQALRGEVGTIAVATSTSMARAALRLADVDLLLLDVNLSDGTALDVLGDLDEQVSAPAVVAMSGVATPLESFRLAHLGVVEYLSKPFGPDALRGALDRALTRPVDLRPFVRRTVGHRAVQAVEQEVRATMVAEAMVRADGSRRKAARLLQVSRQLLQHILRRVTP